MKAVFISFNQAYFESIQTIMDYCEIRGFTNWDNVSGRGSHSGEPHYGNHAWPTLNGIIWTMIDDNKVDQFLHLLHELDLQTEEQGLRAFVMNVERTV